MFIDIISEDKYCGLGLRCFLLFYNKKSFFEFDTVLDSGCDSIFLLKKSEIYQHKSNFISFCRTRKVVISKSLPLRNIHDLIMNYECIQGKGKGMLSSSELNTLFLLFNGMTPKEMEFMFKISHKTISAQKLSALEKLGCKNLKILFRTMNAWENCINKGVHFRKSDT